MSKLNLSKLSKKEKLDLFKVEELEPRLETAWDDNDTCTVNHGCPLPTPTPTPDDQQSMDLII